MMMIRRSLPIRLAAVAGARAFSSHAGEGTPVAGYRAGAAAVAGSAVGLLLLSLGSDSQTVAYADAELAGRRWTKAWFKLPEAVEDRKPSSFLLRESFRKRVFFKYEKRIRLQSTPEKIFEYFASFRNAKGEVFMLPGDLMRAIVPVFPPSESNRIRGGHLQGECLPGELHCAPSPFFMLFDINIDGLISFSEYILFVTLLSIPESSYKVAFKMFDANNDGEIEKEEFKQVMTLMESHNRQGAAHRNGFRVGLKVGNPMENGGLVDYFFGKDGTQRLKVHKFVQFLRELHEEIIRLEFAHYDYQQRGTISAKDFALSMVASADMNHINKFLDRVDEVDLSPHLKDTRITFEEFKAFADLRKKLHPLTVAMFSFGKVHDLLTKQDFQRASTNVCNVSLSGNVVDMVFHIFDSNRDGNLSREEFLTALQRREEHPPAVGILGTISCWLNCGKGKPFMQMTA